MNFRIPVVLSAVVFALAGTAEPAAAEIVYLQSSGRTLSVKGHRVDGDTVVLTLRSGGEVTVDKSLIEKIVPDEVPYPEPASEQAALEGQDSASGSLKPGPYAEIIASLSQAHGVNPMLVQALIQVESGFRPRARSPKGAMGLMQLMPSTARAYRVNNVYDPRSNIDAGIKHLKSLIDKFGDHALALAAYNAGTGAVERFNGMPPYRETRTYVSRILSLAGIR